MCRRSLTNLSFATPAIKPPPWGGEIESGNGKSNIREPAMLNFTGHSDQTTTVHAPALSHPGTGHACAPPVQTSLVMTACRWLRDESPSGSLPPSPPRASRGLCIAPGRSVVRHLAERVDDVRELHRILRTEEVDKRVVGALHVVAPAPDLQAHALDVERVARVQFERVRARGISLVRDLGWLANGDDRRIAWRRPKPAASKNSVVSAAIRLCSFGPRMFR